MPLNLSQIISLAIISALIWAYPATAAWQEPIGIPNPGFGIDTVIPNKPNPWTSTVSNFYYVCPSCSGSTDTNNSNGYPGKARKTIPLTVSSSENTPTVVYLDGSLDGIINDSGGITANGTATAPVYFTSYNPSNKARLTWEKRDESSGFWIGGAYAIVDNVWVGPKDNADQTFGIMFLSGHHLTLRNSEVTGNTTAVDNRFGGVFIGGTASNVVIYNNWIHHLGYLQTVNDKDKHCIGVGGTDTHDVWIVDNRLQYCSGDSVQIEKTNSGTNRDNKRIYIGRNHSDHNRQSGGWAKNATDVVFSQNIAHDFYGDGVYNTGLCYGLQYDAVNVWFILNECYNAPSGIKLSGGDNTGNVYIIGNVIHDLFPIPDSTTDWEGGVVIHSGTDVYVVNNTIYKSDVGILTTSGGTADRAFIYNNIIASRPAAAGFDIHRMVGKPVLEIENNIFPTSPRFCDGEGCTGNELYTTIAGLSNMGTASRNQAVLPQFVSATDLHLQAGSPAIDAGIVSSVYSTFQSFFSIDIRKDMDGQTRAGTYDIGADEYVASGGTPPTAPSGLTVTP